MTKVFRPTLLPPVDWSRWIGARLPVQAVRQNRREPFLDPDMYAERFGDFVPRIKKVTNKVPQQIEAGAGALFTATQQRLLDTLNWMTLQYSAGAPVTQIQEIWPYAMRWAEEYGLFHEAHHQDPENQGGIVPHAALRTEDYWNIALRLLCLGLLTGYADQTERVVRFLDYGNELMGVRDGLIERFVSPFIPARGPLPDAASRHLPYRKLFKVFSAREEDRARLIAGYLDEWYEASRREPYFDQHLHGGFGFYGYWSFEAGVATWILDIDDSSFREKFFYPKDLVDFARSLPRPAALAAQPESSGARLRCEAGYPCPREGYWFTPAKTDSRRFFKQGELMPAFESQYGATIWQWDEQQ